MVNACSHSPQHLCSFGSPIWLRHDPISVDRRALRSRRPLRHRCGGAARCRWLALAGQYSCSWFRNLYLDRPIHNRLVQGRRWAQTDNAGARNAKTDNAGSGNAETDNAGSGNAKTDNAGTRNAKTDNAGAGNAKTDNAGAGNAETNNAGADNATSRNTGNRRWAGTVLDGEVSRTKRLIRSVPRIARTPTINHAVGKFRQI